MAGFLKLGNIEGESVSKGHEKWIHIHTVTTTMNRTRPRTAANHTHVTGETKIDDIHITKPIDKSSVLIQQALAHGDSFDEVHIHLCNQIGNTQEPYLKYVLKDCMLTYHYFSGVAGNETTDQETLHIGFSEIEWTYVVMDSKGNPQGQVPGRYSLPGGHG